MKVLLATDDSEHSEAAVDEIVNRDFPASAEVRVISVVELPSFPVIPGAGVAFYGEAEKPAREAARAAVEKAAAKLCGRPARQGHDGSPLWLAKASYPRRSRGVRCGPDRSRFTWSRSNRTFPARLGFTSSGITREVFGRNCAQPQKLRRAKVSSTLVKELHR